MKKYSGWLIVAMLGIMISSGFTTALGANQVRDINTEIQGKIESSAMVWIDGRFEVPIYTIRIAGFEGRVALEKINLSNLCFGTGVWVKPFSWLGLGAGMGMNYIDLFGETENYSKLYFWTQAEHRFAQAYLSYDADANNGKSKVIKLDGGLRPIRLVSANASLVWSSQPTEEYYQERYLLYLNLNSTLEHRIYAGYQVFGLGTNQGYLDRETTKTILVGLEWQFGHKSFLKEVSVEGQYWTRSTYGREEAFGGLWEEEDQGVRVVLSGTISF